MLCSENYFQYHQIDERNKLINFGAPTKWWDHFYSTVQNLPISWVLSMMRKWKAFMKSCVVFGTGTGVPPQKKNARKKTGNRCAKCNKNQHWTGIVGRGLTKKLLRLTLLARSDLALTCIDCIQRNDQWCFGWEPMIWSLYCMYLINHSRLSVSPFEKGDNHKLILHLTMLDDRHYMQWWGIIATYSPFITTSTLYTYIKWYMHPIFGHVFFLG